jgi:two-component system sensor histidine kinase CreC
MAMAFEKMREALEGKKYAEQYVQTLTHELKSPLSAISGAAELMHEEMPPETRARFLANIRTEAGRIQDIVDRMLELSALENQNMLQKVESVSFGTLVRTVLESKEPLFARKELAVELQMSDDITLKGDSFLLHQAVSNLVQNAIDFSPARGRLEISARLSGKELEFTVDDEGPGIPESILNRVFDRFFSLQRPDTGKKSTGLGLNFVKEVCLLHGGDVSLENRREKGLRATMKLPIQPAAVSGLLRRS